MLFYIKGVFSLPQIMKKTGLRNRNPQKTTADYVEGKEAEV